MVEQLSVKMNDDEWMYDAIMSEEIDMNEDIGDEPSAFEKADGSVDCSAAFNTCEVFASRDELLKWARSVAYENGFVAVIMRSDMHTGKKGRTSFVLIGCERSGKYRAFNKNMVPTVTSTRKCNCPFRLKAKPVPEGEGWMVKLLCGTHNHGLAKSLCGHPYAGRLTEEEKVVVHDMTRSMVKPKNILLTLKEHNPNNSTSLKQVMNARYAYRTRMREGNTELQQLMKLLERDMYIHWHRVKDENVIRDLFWTHPDAVKLTNAYNVVFLIDSTYKTNRYRLPLLDIVGVTPTGLTFSAAFALLEAERVDNVVWALERFRGMFIKTEFFPKVIVTDRDLALMSAITTVFPMSTNLLCRFHIEKNVKAKCKTLIRQSNAWEYVMEAWGSLVDCGNENEFGDYMAKFDIACSPWPAFVDYVKTTWLNPHKEKFVSAWTKQFMHLGNTTTNRVEAAHSSLKRMLQNSLGDLCSVWDAMHNMLTLQHTEIRASLERSTHVVGHVFKVTLYKRLIGMVSRYALNQLAAEYERVRYAGKSKKRCGCVMRTTHGLPCACELAKYVLGSIPIDAVDLFWRRLSFQDQGVDEGQVDISGEMEAISMRFNNLDFCGKVTLKTKLREIAYPDKNSMRPPPEKVKTKGAQKRQVSQHARSTKRDPSYWEYMDELHSVQNSCSTPKVPATSSADDRHTKTNLPMLDQFHTLMHDFIVDIIDVKADGNCGFRVIAALLGYGEESWSLVRNHLLKELSQWSDEYIALFGGFDRFEQLKRSLLVDGLSKVTIDKWMDITDLGYVIASRYNLVLVSLSLRQSMTFFPLRSQPPTDVNVHRVICIGHVFGNHFVQVALKAGCPIPPPALLWSRNCYNVAHQWIVPYEYRIEAYRQLQHVRTDYVDLGL